MNCLLNVSDHKECKILSFKAAEIGNKDNPIYLNKINEIYLINENDKEEKINVEGEDGLNEEEGKKNYTKLIIIIVCSFIGVVGIIKASV